MNECFYTSLLNCTAHLLVEDGIVIGAGKILLDYLGYEPAEIIGLNELEALDLLMGVKNQAWKSNENTTCLLTAKNGEIIFFDIHYIEHASNRQRLYIFQKKERLSFSIRQDLNIIHQLISNSPFGMALFSAPDIVLLNANQTWLNRLDEPFNRKEESVGKHVSEIITGWKGSVIEKIMNSVLKSCKAVHMPEYRYSGLKKGVSFWNIAYTPIFEQGKIQYFVEITYDVTETVVNRKKIRIQKEQLFKQYQQFETVVENMSDALFVIYPDANVVPLNEEAKNIQHLFHNFQLTDKLSSDIKYFDSNNIEIPFQKLPVFSVLKGETLKAFRITVKANADIQHFSISGRPVYDNNNNISFVIVCIRDVTAQVEQDNYILKIEKEKKESLERSIAIKNEFITLVSHEFKTPLAVIGTAIQALELLHGQELSEKVKRYISTIKQNSLRQLRLVNNLLDITRGTAEQIRLNNRNIDIVTLTSMIVDSVKIYAAQKNLQIFFDTNIDSKPIWIDDEKYERVLLNILSNAIKFTPKGKSIYVKLYIEDGFVNISVKDEGVGIPEDKIDVIFERFGQVDNSLSRQAEGSGIGLYLVKVFVEKMGGNVSVKSVPYEGTTFFVKLPDTVVEDNDENNINTHEIIDNKRIIQMMNIEFSDIYLIK